MADASEEKKRAGLARKQNSRRSASSNSNSKATAGFQNPRSKLAYAKNIKGVADRNKPLEKRVREEAGKRGGQAIGAAVSGGTLAVVGGWIGKKVLGSRVGKWIIIILFIVILTEIFVILSLMYTVFSWLSWIV